MSDEVGYLKIAAVVVGIIGAVVGFFKGFQTKASCSLAHKANKEEQLTYRSLVDVKLDNIKDDVSEIKAIIQAKYGHN